MFATKRLILAAIAFGFAFGPPALAAEPHAHGDASAVQLQLDHGKKWRTDDSLRRGMNEIRAAMAESLAAIHGKTFTSAQYDALAALIQARIDDVVGNCKLPEDADQLLHPVLEQIIDGVAEMKAATNQDRGAEKIVHALTQYGQYFDHAGWQPLSH